MTTIGLEGVGFVYPDGTRALSGVDLTIGAGESVAIIGQNGSGKSTLVRLCNGLLRPTEGRVLHDGADVAGSPVAGLAGRVGIVFQNPDRQIFAGKVRDEVAFGPRNLGRRGAELEAAVDAALAATGLDGEAATNPYDLGYSRRKLLALASILAMGTPVVVLDEPTTGQDGPGVARVGRIVDALREAGKSVVAITHDMEFAAAHFGRIVVMRRGEVAADGPPSTVFGPANLELLASTGLRPPPAARVAAALGIPMVPARADELLELLADRT